MSDIERELSEFLVARADQARLGSGSVEEVRMLSRRRTRQRGVAGAGMLVAASTLGIGALVSRSPEPQRVAGASGQGTVQPQGSWRCSGPIDHTDMTGVSDPQLAELVRENLIMRVVQPAADGFYYMSDCEFTTELPPTPPAVEVSPAGTEAVPPGTEPQIATTDGPAPTDVPTNHPPVAVDDLALMAGGELLTIGVLPNDYDPDGDVLTSELLKPPLHGTVTGGSYGGFVYQVDAGYVGTDSFVYLLRDSRGLTATGTCTIVISETPPAG